MRLGHCSRTLGWLAFLLAVVLPAPAALAAVEPSLAVMGPAARVLTAGRAPLGAGSAPVLVRRSAPLGAGSALAVAVGASPQSAAEDARTQTLYVPNSSDNTVSVVDLRACSSGNVAGCAQAAPVIHVGNLPLGVAVDESTNTVYIANALDDTVSVINGAECDAVDTAGCGERPATVTVGAFDNAVVVDPITHMVFVTNQDASPGSVSVIDGNACTGTHPAGCAGQPLTDVQVGGGASGIGINAATDTVYVANTGEDSNNVPVRDGNTVSVINGATCRPAHAAGCVAVGTAAVGTSPAAIAADPATNTVYVANTYDGAVHEGTVSVLDGAHCDGSDPTGCAAQAPPQVTVGADPIGVAVDDRTHVAFVANGLDDTVSEIATSACNAAHTLGCAQRPPTIALGGGPTWPVIDSARRTLYVVQQVDNQVAVLSDTSCVRAASCRHPVPTTRAGRFPNAAGIDTRFQTVYIGDADAYAPPYAVSMINANACNVARRSGCGAPPLSVPALGAPSTIDVNQKTNTVYVASNAALQVLNAATCNAITTAGCSRMASVPAGGFSIAVDASTDTIYAAQSRVDGVGYVSVIDGRHCNAADTSGCAAQTVASTPRVAIGHAPGGIAIDAATHTLYAVDILDHTLSVIDTRHCHAGDTTQCAAQTPATVTFRDVDGPISVAVDDSTHTAYVTDTFFSFSLGALSMIDTRHCQADDTSQCATLTAAAIPAPAGPKGTVRVDPRTDAVYVANLSDSTVSVYDGRHCNAMTATRCAPIRTIPVGSSPSDLALDPQRGSGYVPNFYDEDASVFALAAPREP
jgi:DNA-binding beta-propeller fold protein YncE